MALDSDLLQTIKKKNGADIESAWNAHVESDPRDNAWFFAVAEEMRSAKMVPKMLELLLNLADAQAVDDAWEEAFATVSKAIELAPRVRETREKALEMVRNRYADRDDMGEVLATFNVENADDPARAFTSLHDWLRFEPGAGYWLFGRGLGKVAEANLGLQKVKVNFEKAAPLVMRADEAKRLLTFLPNEHFMMRRLEDPAGVKAEAKENPGLFVRDLVQRFGRPLSSAEIRECMTGVVEGGAWTGWWNRAKSHPQVLPVKQPRNSFEWTDSAESAEKLLVDEFKGASSEQRLELARKHVKRGGAVKKAILDGLAKELAAVDEPDSPAAVELACLVEELTGKLPEGCPVDLDAVLRAEGAVETVAAVTERRYRERLFARLREVRPDDWAEQYHQAFFVESDLRVLSQIYEALEAEGPERAAERIVAESVSQPRRTPRAFVWVTKNVLRRGELAGRANHALMSKIIEALDAPEFKDLKAPLREAFEEGGIAFAVFEASDRDGVDHLLNLIDSAGSLEEHRKTDIRRAIFRKYPDIRKRTDEDTVFATAESIEEKRLEFEKLVKVDIPENAEAIRVAREYGDLRENFEYHAARQKHEVLNAHAARLHGDLKRARAIDPESVVEGKVGIGSRFSLRSVDGGPDRPVTILGPWDSDPDSGIYSYLSDFAQALIGLAEGEEVEVDGRRYRVEDTRAWRAPQEQSSESA